MFHATQNCPAEWSFTAAKDHPDPFNDITLDILFTDPEGKEKKVPAFWAGDSLWKVRYASRTVGRHAWRSVCSDTSDSGLHGREGTLEVKTYEGENPLLVLEKVEPNEGDRRFSCHGCIVPIKLIRHSVDTIGLVPGPKFALETSDRRTGQIE